MEHSSAVSASRTAMAKSSCRKVHDMLKGGYPAAIATTCDNGRLAAHSGRSWSPWRTVAVGGFDWTVLAFSMLSRRQRPLPRLQGPGAPAYQFEPERDNLRHDRPVDHRRPTLAH